MAEIIVKDNKMGNCKYCYYSSYSHEDNNDVYYKCHRYPKIVDVSSQHYCGEFARIVSALA